MSQDVVDDTLADAQLEGVLGERFACRVERQVLDAGLVPEVAGHLGDVRGVVTLGKETEVSVWPYPSVNDGQSLIGYLKLHERVDFCRPFRLRAYIFNIGKTSPIYLHQVNGVDAAKIVGQHEQVPELPAPFPIVRIVTDEPHLVRREPVLPYFLPELHRLLGGRHLEVGVVVELAVVDDLGQQRDVQLDGRLRDVGSLLDVLLNRQRCQRCHPCGLRDVSDDRAESVLVYLVGGRLGVSDGHHLLEGRAQGV